MALRNDLGHNTKESVVFGVTQYGKQFDFAEFLKSLKKVTSRDDIPVVSLMALQGDTPFKVLFTTMLTPRTKDTTTVPAAKRLFARVKTTKDIAQLCEDELAELIKPVGFYKTKAKNMIKTAQYLIKHHGGKVPRTVEELIKLPGVGQKTANLVVAESFQTDAVVVDVHVHRISNRLGIINTKKPEQTQVALEHIIPQKLWRIYNPSLVAYGQTICTPVSPKCSQCVVRKYCKRVGVTTNR